LGRRHISTSGFAYMAAETAVFAVRSAKPCFSWASCFQSIITWLLSKGTLLLLFHARAVADAWDMAIIGVCLCVSVCVCLRSNRKTAWTMNTKLGTHILYDSRSVCIDPEVKRSKVKVTRLRKPSRSHVCSWLLLRQCTAAVAGVGLHVVCTVCSAFWLHFLRHVTTMR